MSVLAIDRSPYVAPSATGPIHESLTPAWLPLEYPPKNRRWRRYRAKDERRGYYLPRGELRMIDEDAYVHHSVVDRMAAGYDPANLPARQRIVGPD